MELHREQIFVFVVCGGREHIDTLHFSLKALQRFSAKRTIVVTDSSRNEIAAKHSEIIDIKTPTQYNHHQASIFLKTGLHKFLPKGNLYCYIDTDVVALSMDVDTIFEQYQSPITFCTDHCTIDQFSPMAINCDCPEAFKIDAPKPYFYYRYFKENIQPKLLYIDDCIQKIEKAVAKSKSNRWVYAWHRFKYSLPGKYYSVNSDFKMEKATGQWFDKNNLHLHYEDSAKDELLYISNKTGFRYNPTDQGWYRKDDSSLIKLSCTHLRNKLKERFDLTIATSQWQHWNGGVFLFDDKSESFLSLWHESTLAIFNEKEWRTRDQGTLIATVGHFGLQNHHVLPLKFNFIVDYNKKDLQYKGNLNFKFENKDVMISPFFIHIFHHWGDKEWAVWNDVEKYILG